MIESLKFDCIWCYQNEIFRDIVFIIQAKLKKNNIDKVY